MILEYQHTSLRYTVVNIISNCCIEYNYLFIKRLIIILIAVEVDVEPTYVLIVFNRELVLNVNVKIWFYSQRAACISCINRISLYKYKIGWIVHKCKLTRIIKELTHDSTCYSSRFILLEFKLYSLQVSIQIIQHKWNWIRDFDIIIDNILECFHFETQFVNRVLTHVLRALTNACLGDSVLNITTSAFETHILGHAQFTLWVAHLAGS